MSWVVASKIVLRVAVMIVDFVGRDYLGIEIRDPSGTIGNEGWRESGGCRGVAWIVTLRVVRPQLNCGNEIAGLGLLGLFFWWGVMCAGLYCGDWGGCARACIPITTGASVHLSTFKEVICHKGTGRPRTPE